MDKRSIRERKRAIMIEEQEVTSFFLLLGFLEGSLASLEGSLANLESKLDSLENC
jgi:hypothetical protein